MIDIIFDLALLFFAVVGFVTVVTWVVDYVVDKFS